MKAVVIGLSWILGLVILINLAFAAFVAAPDWAFTHSAGTERIRIHATQPLPPDTADWLSGELRALDAGPLPPGEAPVDIYVSGGGWREWILFAPARGAGGVVYPFNDSAVFLSGADVASNRLIKGAYVIQPPRTLAYYLKHEITHLAQMRRTGRLAYLSLPNWVREGVADFVALGPASKTVRDAVENHPAGADRLPLMQMHGVYPEFRVMVTDRVESGGTLPELLESP